jgi:hypothetical protein
VGEVAVYEEDCDVEKACTKTRLDTLLSEVFKLKGKMEP